MGWLGLLFTVVALSTLAGGAVAEPVCSGAAPAAGAALHGPVLYVESAAVLCVSVGEAKTSWVAVTLDKPAASRGALMAAAFGKNARCAIGADQRGACTIEDVDLATVLRRADVRETAANWR